MLTLSLAQTFDAMIRPRLHSSPWLNPRGFHRARELASAILKAMPAQADWPSPTTAWRIHRPKFTETGLVVVPAGNATHVLAFVKLPQSREGMINMRQQTYALATLNSDLRLADWCTPRPSVLHSGELHGQTYSVERAVPGWAAHQVLADPARRSRALAAMLMAIRPLHQLTAQSTRVDAALLARWVDQPISVIRQAIVKWPGASADLTALERLQDEMKRGLEGRELATSWIHGDYWPGNILMDDRAERVTGIVDWDRARPDELPVHDVLSALISARMLTQRQEMGQVLESLLGRQTWSDEERRWLDATALPGEQLADHTVILLYWARHTAFNLEQSQRYARHWLWMRRNVQAVLTRM